MAEESFEKTPMEETAIENQEKTAGSGKAEVSEPLTELAELQKETERLNEEISSLQKSVDENYNRYLRALADSENIRKRSVKEKSDAMKYGMESFFKELLPVLDSFDKAVSNVDDKEQNSSVLGGVLLVHKQLLALLDKNGVLPVKSEGENFDPNVHQAIQRVESKEAKTEMVKEEYAKGYTLHDRLLRPAMVSVEVPTESP